MSHDDLWARTALEGMPEAVLQAWARTDWTAVAEQLFALAAERRDASVLAPVLALDLEMTTASLLAPRAAEITALPPSPVREAALAFLAARIGADDDRTAASVRSAVTSLATFDDLLAGALAASVAVILVDRARWVESGWFVRAAERAVHAARAADAPPSTVESLWFRMMTAAVLVEWNTYDGTRRLDALAAALAVPRARNLLRTHHGPALVAMGQILAARGEFGAGAVSIARGIPLLPPRSHMRASAQARLAYVKFRQGDWQGARRAARLVRDVDDAHNAWTQALILSVDTLEPATGGDLAAASARIEDARRALTVMPSVQAETVLLHARLAITIGANDWAAMLQLLEDAEEPGYRRIFTEHEWRALWGMALRNLQRFDRYRELIATWAEQPGATEHSYYWAHVALLAQVDHDPASALAAALRAREMLSEGDDPLGRTWARLVVGTIVSLFSNPTEGMESFEAARAELSAIGANGFVRLCTQIIEDVAGQIARASGDAMHALTSQQRRVAELVAEGFTSAEIAQILYLSKKTIDFHVANILSRLGLASRRELVRRMARGGTAD